MVGRQINNPTFKIKRKDDQAVPHFGTHFMVADLTIAVSTIKDSKATGLDNLGLATLIVQCVEPCTKYPR